MIVGNNTSDCVHVGGWRMQFSMRHIEELIT